MLKIMMRLFETFIHVRCSDRYVVTNPTALMLVIAFLAIYDYILILTDFTNIKLQKYAKF